MFWEITNLGFYHLFVFVLFFLWDLVLVTSAIFNPTSLWKKISRSFCCHSSTVCRLFSILSLSLKLLLNYFPSLPSILYLLISFCSENPPHFFFYFFCFLNAAIVFSQWTSLVSVCSAVAFRVAMFFRSCFRLSTKSFSPHWCTEHIKKKKKEEKKKGREKNFWQKNSALNCDGFLRMPYESVYEKKINSVYNIFRIKVYA